MRLLIAFGSWKRKGIGTENTVRRETGAERHASAAIGVRPSTSYAIRTKEEFTLTLYIGPKALWQAKPEFKRRMKAESKKSTA
jgi:hypothetical protein